PINKPRRTMLSSCQNDCKLFYKKPYEKTIYSNLSEFQHTTFEIKAIKQSIKTGGILSLAALSTAGAIHLKHTYTQDSMRIRRSFLPDINVGDISGAGGVAQGAGSVIKGVALVTA